MKKVEIVGLLFILALAAWGCSRDPVPKGGAKATTKASGNLAIPVTVAKAEVQKVERTLEMVGSLMPFEEVTVSSQVPGRVEAVLADLGDRVTRGQALVKLEQREFRLNEEQAAAALSLSRENLARARAASSASQAAVETAQAELAAARAQVDKAEVMVQDARVNLQRIERLFAEGIVAASQKDVAQTQYDSAQASLRAAQAEYRSRQSRINSAMAQRQQDEAAIKVAQAAIQQAEATLAYSQKKLGDTVIYAPISGEVQKKLVSGGETIKENLPLLSLVSTHPLKLEGEIAERYIPEVSLGKTVKIKVEAFPQETFTGRISRISPALQRESRSLTVQALVDNPQGRLKPGFFVKAHIVTKAEAATFVPVKALVSIVGITKVFVIDQEKGTVIERMVSPASKLDELIEITQGIKAGELVAVSNLSRLSGGSLVKVTGSEEKRR